MFVHKVSELCMTAPKTAAQRVSFGTADPSIDIASFTPDQKRLIDQKHGLSKEMLKLQEEINELSLKQREEMEPYKKLMLIKLRQLAEIFIAQKYGLLKEVLKIQRSICELNMQHQEEMKPLAEQMDILLRRISEINGKLRL